MTSIPHLYYVYVLARPNGTPFYVGKGAGRRIFGHENEAKTGCQCHKCRVIRKIWRNGGEVQRYTMLTTMDECEAFTYECELITLYGRKTLCNKTDGGEGASGCPNPKSKETRKRISETLKGRPLAPHVYEQFKSVNIGRKYTQERIDKVAMANSGGKQYIAVSPDNQRYEGIKSLHSFEKQHSLPKGGLDSVIRGRSTHCNGWIVWVDGQEPKPRPRMYTVVAPDGTRYDNIWNVAAFAKEHAIDGHYLRAMLRGDWPHAKGWTGWRSS